MDNIKPLKRIAAINDISCLGKCSLTVALPVVSASGVECACIPTALLSTHTGEFTGWTFRDLTEEMLPIAEHWRSMDVRFDGIYSGYLASPEQERMLETLIDDIAGENTIVVTDPAMADNGEYYANLGESMCRAFRRLCARADVITPNVTEAAFLTGMEYRPAPHDEEYIETLLALLAELGPKVVTVTGVRPSHEEIGYAALDTRTGETHRVMNEARPGVFYGTGDIFASSFAALLTRGAGVDTALSAAAALVSESIARSAARNTPRRYGVDFEGALPGYIKRVGEIFAEK